MWEDTVEGVRKDVKRWRATFADRAVVNRRPTRIALHPLTWKELVTEFHSRPETYTFPQRGTPLGTLFGMTVVEDATLTPGTWRLEH